VELLYPFPREELATLIRGYPSLREIVWVQEEPRKHGAQKFMLPQLREIVGPDVTVRDNRTTGALEAGRRVSRSTPGRAGEDRSDALSV